MSNKLKTSLAGFVLLFAMACNNGQPQTNTTTSTLTDNTSNAGSSTIKDDVSAKNVVQVAIGSKDHTTLVAAVKAAELVDVLSTTGPFTVFAPTNAAFDKLPAGTVEGLLKTEKKEALTDILQYHVSVGVFKADMFQDGQIIGQVNGGNITISKKADGIYVNGTAKIIASIPASNGIIHVIDAVLLPPSQ